MPCPSLLRCDTISYVVLDGSRVTVGLQHKEPDVFVIICLRDAAGCQHITTKTDGALALMERLARVMRDGVA